MSMAAAGMSVAAADSMAGLRRERWAAGVQLYTARDLLVKRPRETLQAIADIGYREVEMLRNQVKLLASILPQVKLKPISLHFETPLLTGNWTAWKHADMPPIEQGVTFEDCIPLARDHRLRIPGVQLSFS